MRNPRPAMPTRLTQPIGRWLYRTVDGLRPEIDRVIMRGSAMPDRPVLDPAQFSWIRALERNWTRVRDEALAIGPQEIPPLASVSPDHGRIAADRRWKSFFLHGYGYRRDENCELAPATAWLVSKIPGLVSASFSVLEAGCHIPRHRGVTKAMLTCHLPLKVPSRGERCRMVLDGGTLHWSEGRALVFDDTFEHEVWNETDEDRTILLLQVRRPCRGLAAAMQESFLWAVKRSRFVQDIRRNLDRLRDGIAPAGHGAGAQER